MKSNRFERTNIRLLQVLIVIAFLIPLTPAVTETTPPSAVAIKYGERLQNIFSFQAKIESIHPIFKKVYPLAIVEDKTFYVFEPVPEEKAYRLCFHFP